MSRQRRKGLTPSLFPFLAVLVCTMGALMLLLTMVTRKAKEQGEQDAAAQIESIASVAIEDAEWRQEQWQVIRDKQTGELEAKRGQLAHIENHIQRLNQQLRALTDQIAAAQVPEQAQLLEKEIVDLKAKAEELQTKIAENEAEARVPKKPRVVLMPYRGPNGTVRRPVYIECVGNQIIIQPENIRMDVKTLRGPLGPGNPLDAALRAIRLHWQATDPEPPYPLIVVRPNGIVGYAVARAAMSAWDDQFGYELVPQDVQLAYLPPDPVLADRIQVAISEAVQRRDMLMAAMPGRFQSNRGNDPLDRAMRAAGDSGGAPIEPGQPLDPSEKWEWKAGGEGFTAGNGGGGDGLGPGGIAQANASLANPSGEGDGVNEPSGFGPQGTSAARSGNSAFGNTAGGTGSAGMNPAAGGSATTGPQGTNGQDGQPGTGLANGSNGKGTANASSGGSASGSEGASTDSNASSTFAAGGPGGSSSMPMMGSEAPPSDDPRAHKQPPGQNSGTASKASSSKSAQSNSLAKRRGKGWALPDNARKSGPAVVRRIHVVCYPDRYEIVDPSGRRTPFRINPQDPHEAIMSLATSVRQRIENWGEAISGGRWEPTLSVEVAPDAQQSYDNLVKLLDNSGLVVQMRTAL